MAFISASFGVTRGYPPGKQVWLKAGDKVTTDIKKIGAPEVTLVLCLPGRPPDWEPCLIFLRGEEPGPGSLDILV